MEESSFLSMLPHKVIKPETSHQLNNQDFHHCSTSMRSGAKQDSDPPVPLQPGQAAFRLLCRLHTAGGVIGSSGSIIKRLEALSGVKIRIEKGLPNCHERVINIVGDATVKKKISIIGSLKNGGNEDKEMVEVEVSKAQEGLIRVFERILEVQGGGENENDDINSNSKGLIGCRLLAAAGQIGAVLGKGGKIVNGIKNNSGAKISILKEQIPACAEPKEAVIQIMGGVVSVKKALLAVSCCLQDCKLGERTPGQMSSQGVSHDMLKYSVLNNNSDSLALSGNAVDYQLVGHSLSEGIDRKLSLDEDDTLKKVVFRFLCSNASAGGVIGKGATIVKSLEKETGACIKFSPLVSGLRERVATISSVENSNPLHSPAQIAIIHVFTRSVQVALDHGLTPGMGKGENVTARILVERNQMGCLVDEGRRVASDISTASGVEIQLLGAVLIPNCTVEDDKVVQIMGEYENVKSALFQVTGRLRDNYFPRMGFNGSERTHSADSAMACCSSNVTAKTRRNVTRPEDDAGNLKTFSSWLKNESLDEDSTLKNVVFRLLCSNASAGGVIGKDANIVKSLEKGTGAYIKFSPLVSGLRERVATISSVENPNPLYSPAQMAIIRVFTRSAEVALDHGLIPGMGKGENVTARILVERNHVGCLVDEGGRVASDISAASGVEIQLLGAGLIPNCTVEDDKVVQIMGEYENVKSALFQVTGRLRENYFPRMGFNGSERTHSTDSATACSSSKGRAKIRRNVTRPEDDADNLQTFSSGLKNGSLDEDITLKNVVFRLLCSNASAGGVIGKGANMVKSMEKETGACIKFSSLVSGLRERVATISSVESQNPLYSPAQIAIIRVFTRSVEVALDHGLIPGMAKGENVTARILVERNQLGCLVDEGGRVASDISTASGVEIQLLGAGLIPNCTAEDDRVVQIMGEYENVKSALFQVTGRLRENYFPRIGFNGSERMRSSDSATACSSSNGGVIDSSSQPEQLSRLSSVNQLDYLIFVHKSSHPLSTGSQQKNAKTRKNVTRPEDDSPPPPPHPTLNSRICTQQMIQNLDMDAIPYKTVEVMIPRDVFRFVYGDDGSNLILLKEISGATVRLLDPCAGDDKGKVIISGSPEQIQIAQSLLQAFISK
ncbi:unnamed protein product [Fraxinus pennsylvanica]|uniref:K Homology domain-containing protein n=1 Tax=Fraxinus pennsylvanica TaxID=56036 RepID=A0AAD2E6T7_9LAMI|nr:unnamed protein product [Fraxinus pennsylvanica]